MPFIQSAKDMSPGLLNPRGQSKADDTDDDYIGVADANEAESD